MSLILTDDELVQLTGHRQPARQLGALHKAGFHRARLVAGRIVLERAHYEAVAAGIDTRRPKVRRTREAA